MLFITCRWAQGGPEQYRAMLSDRSPPHAVTNAFQHLFSAVQHLWARLPSLCQDMLMIVFRLDLYSDL